MHFDGIADASVVEPAEIAGPVVKTHQSMNSRYLPERTMYGLVSRLLSQTLNADTHQRSEPWLCSHNCLRSII
jgi:hypothetical protein